MGRHRGERAAGDPSATSVAISARVSSGASLGPGCRIWDLSQIREGAQVGPDTTIGRNVYVDHDVVIGANCKIQNNALIYWPAILADGVFIGPGAILTNDRRPRALNPDGSQKGDADWTPEGVHVGEGASVGAGAVIVGGVQIGDWAMVGAGAVVTRDVAAHSMVVGSPATHVAWIGSSGHRLVEDGPFHVDPSSGERYRLTEGRLEVSP
jgi:acetyltransferase-like isoleucine patch superfamily enzyme